jgi:CRP/FNR family transcriptional regulator, cyclic AMP receptor protein
LNQPPPDVLAVYRQAPLFAGLGPDVLQHLVRLSHLRRLRDGEHLFNQGERGEAVYMVCAGRLAVVLATPDGRELVINEMRVGEFCGELALFPGHTHTANAVARQPGFVAAIACGQFLALLESQPGLMRRLLEVLVERLRASTVRESALAFLTAPARLARLMLTELEPDAPGVPLVAVSQEDLAQRVGVSRQTVAKTLGGWRRAGWIITGRGRIMLVDQSALRRLASELAP